MNRRADVTELLREMSEGSRASADRLLPLVYEELRQLAESRLRRERPDHTLQATALVHEAYLRMVDQTRVQWSNRVHFLALAAQAIRRILVDYARAHQRKKRGGGAQKLSLDADLALNVSTGHPDTDLIALDLALAKLAEEDPDLVRTVEARFFAGLTEVETAEVLGVSERTVQRHWQYAKAWLYRELSGSPRTSGVEHGDDS